MADQQFSPEQYQELFGNMVGKELEKMKAEAEAKKRKEEKAKKEQERKLQENAFLAQPIHIASKL
jgi:hypothetical protein